MPTSTTPEPNITITAGDLSANIPLKSIADFRFSFAMTCSKFNGASRQQIIEAIESAIPELKNASAWADSNAIYFYAYDQNHPGICKHLVDMFAAANLNVSAMGGNYTEPPFLANSPVPENLSSDLKDMQTLKTRIKEIVCKLTIS